MQLFSTKFYGEKKKVLPHVVSTMFLKGSQGEISLD